MDTSYGGQITPHLPDGWWLEEIDAGHMPNIIYFGAQCGTHYIDICTRHDLFWRYPQIVRDIIRSAVTSAYRNRYLIPYTETDE